MVDVGIRVSGQQLAIWAIDIQLGARLVCTYILEKNHQSNKIKSLESKKNR